MKGDFIITTLIIILICVILVYWFVIRRSKSLHYDTILSINGGPGLGKTSVSVWKLRYFTNFANRLWRHRVWWRKFRHKDYSDLEQPLAYSNIPIYDNIKTGKLWKYYRPLTQDIILRAKRPHFKSIIYQSEVSLIACSQDGRNQTAEQRKISEQLTLQLKLIRHEMHGCYRSIFGRGYPNMIIETQSKNDTHYAYDRVLNQCLYLFKSISIPFFRIVWAREMLLIDSVENDFDDDVAESKSVRWFLVPKRVFKWYDSYSYRILSDNLPIQNYKGLKNSVINGRFEIATFHSWQEINESNKLYWKELNDIELQEKTLQKS